MSERILKAEVAPTRAVSVGEGKLVGEPAAPLNLGHGPKPKRVAIRLELPKPSAMERCDFLKPSREIQC